MQRTILLSTAAAALALGLAAPAAAQPATAPRTVTIANPVPLTVETYRLANGLNVVLSRDTSVPVVAVNVWYHVGSGNEVAGRTGFAHLFEHMMFQGSANVGDDQHFKLISEAGGTLNGTTNADRTNYFEAVPSNFLERVLWQEADRMGFLLNAMTQEKLDNQRSVVQNERRQNYDNAPYGLAGETISRLLFPAGHPYSWTTIGSLTDLNAASMEDVSGFFRQYYAPNNASLAVVGDFDPAQARRWIERYFGSIPSGPPITRPTPQPVRLASEVRHMLEDRVQLPRLYVVWPSPAHFQPGDADLNVLGYILAGDRSSRLHQRLVLRDQLAQFVAANQGGRALAGQFGITVQARPGIDLDRVLAIVDEEVARLRTEGPTQREVERARNNLEVQFVQRMQTTLGRADALNSYATFNGDPAYIQQDYARYATVTIGSVKQSLDWLGAGRIVLSVVPQGQTQLQASR
ncbi:pitrilysin family protein [Longimicrobium sp.]|jgi:zinc protease|uniref:M16 family metallopeptidase n=1 Tax=Longimicrobium sp. TaxID=2029185 RepID=UPI002ED81B34